MADYLLIINPASHSGRTAALVPALHELFADTSYALHITERQGHAADIVRSQVTSPTQAVVAIGGDGTISEVTNALMGFSEEVRPSLGIIAGGSGNDAAKGFGLPHDLASAQEVIRGRSSRFFDVGLVNNRYFAGSFSIGLDALVVAKTLEYKVSKEWSGSRLYYSALLNVIFTQLKPIALDIAYRDDEGSDHTLHADVLLSACTNGQTYGGGIPINPSARPDDGFLTLSWVDSLSLPATLMRLPLIVNGKHGKLRAYHTSHITSAVIESSTGESLIAQTDGELFNDTRFEVSTIPNALRVIVPE